MDLKRFSVILLVFSGLLVGTFFLVNRSSQRRAKDQNQTKPTPDKPKADPAKPEAKPAPTGPATRPAAASQPTSAPSAPTTSHAATTKPTTSPATTQPVKEQPQWLEDYAYPDKMPQRPGFAGWAKPNDGYLLELELTADLAGVKRARLANYFETVKDKQHAAEGEIDQAAYRKQRLAGKPVPRNAQSQYIPVDTVYPAEKGSLPLSPFATRDIVVARSGAGWPGYLWEDKANRQWWYTGTETTEKGVKVTFAKYYYWAKYSELSKVAPAERQKKFPYLRIWKTFEIRKDDYTTYVTVRFENHTGAALTVTMDQVGPSGLEQIPNARGDDRMVAFGRYDAKSQEVEVRLKSQEDILKEGLDDKEKPRPSNDADNPTLWVGCTNQYFASMLYLVPRKEDSLAASSYKAEFYIDPVDLAEPTDGGASRTVSTGVRITDLEVPADTDRKPCEVKFELFVGPKSRGMFSDSGAKYHRDRYKELSYVSTINLGGCWCQIDLLTLGMMWLLNALSVVAFGNYGIAIILLVIIVRLLLHPLTKKGQVSMMRMQKLGPQIQKLKEKYADDKETLNKEMMRLYRTAGATPILGCLPMFLQMPIWIALFTSLRASVELRHAAFLPVWITDLSAPDQLFSFGRHLPLIGTHFNLLPPLVAVAMYFQAKLNPSMTGQAATPQQQSQQKMMRWMMPIMMLFIFYTMPSGLNLYIMTSMFASVAEQKVIRKHIEAREAAEAAAVTTVQVPGKGSRSNRPKKPKGPMRFK